MTPYGFTKAILEEAPIKLFNYGHYKRSFTYIDDIVEWVVRLIDQVPKVKGLNGTNGSNGNGNGTISDTPFRVLNLGHDESVDMLTFTRLLETKLHKDAIIQLLPPQPGELFETKADIGQLVALTGYRPRTTVEEGLDRLIEWYLSHVHIDQNVT